MGMINAVNSLRYDMHGRKRKTNSLSKPKKSHSFNTSRNYVKRIREEKAFKEEQLKISSSYAIAPAYNKGAYQVIPKSDLKYIGKK